MDNFKTSTSKYFLLALSLFFWPATSRAGVCGSGTLTLVNNQYTSRPDFVCVNTSGGSSVYPATSTVLAPFGLRTNYLTVTASATINGTGLSLYEPGAFLKTFFSNDILLYDGDGTGEYADIYFDAATQGLNLQSGFSGNQRITMLGGEIDVIGSDLEITSPLTNFNGPWFVRDGNSDFGTFIGTLPVNGGFGPQAVQDGIWNKTNTSQGNFHLVVSETPQYFGASGIPYIPGNGSDLYMSETGISYSYYNSANRLGLFGWGYDTTSGFTVSRGNVGIGETSAGDKLDVQTPTAIDGTGTLTDDGSGNITGSGTSFLSEVSVGDQILDLSDTEFSTVIRVISNTSLTLDTPTDSFGSNFTITKPIQSWYDTTPSKVASISSSGRTLLGLVGPVGGYNNKVGFDLFGDFAMVRFGKNAPASNTTRVFQFTNAGDSNEYFSWDIDPSGNPAFNLHGKDFLWGRSPSGIFIETARLTNAGNLSINGTLKIVGTSALQQTLIAPIINSTTSVSVSSLNVTTSGNLYSGGALVGLVFSTYSASGAYNFTTTTASLAIGTSSSTITLTSSGTYRLDGLANLRYNGATFAANQFVTINLYRQNNTPGVLANSQSQEETPISVSALTNQFGQFNLNPVFYTTTNINDVISLQGSISATPGAGNFQATEASLVATRLY